MLYVKITLKQDSEKSIKCFYKSLEIASTVIEDKPEIIFEIANITDVLIPLSFNDGIDNIEYLKESILIEYVEKKSSNFFIEINENSSIMQKLKNMDLDLHNPLEVIEVDAQHNQKSQKISLLKYLNFLALDPDNAKDLGLYAVDENITDDESYLYIIKGTYHIGYKYYYGFVYLEQQEELPSIKGKCILSQLDGITYEGSTPLGQIALNFNLSKEAVFYDIKRFNKADKIVTEYPNHMVDRNSNYCFTETNLPLNDIISYSITPIDIFGRRGETIQTETIVLKNNSLSVPVKNIKAKIIQNGFPWNNIEEYKNQEINKGIAHISFEYGEQQHLVAPDADKVTLVYRVGNKTEEEDWNGLDKWNVIESIDIKPPTIGQVIFRNTLEMISFDYEIKEVREKVYKNENNQEVFYTELLLNEAHLEPDLFENFTFKYQSNTFTVSHSHAGVAYDSDNTTNKDYTTRFILDGKDHGIAPNKTIRLMPSKSSELLVLITFKPSSVDLEAVSGGEIALNIRYYNNQAKVVNESFTGKVISDVKRVSPDKISVIARFKEQNLIGLLKDDMVSQDIEVGVYYYPPYLLSNQSLSVNQISTDSNISIEIQDEPFETVWFSAITHQKRSEKNISSLAIPFETKVMNPPRILADIPIPKLHNEKKYAPPANVDGYSNPVICWDSTLKGVKYELSRALDKTIIATDKKNWLQGIGSAISNNIFEGIVDREFIKDEKNGTFSFIVENQNSYPTLKEMEQGRIKIQDTYSQLLKVLNNENSIKVVCKPFIEIDKLQSISDGTSFIAEQAPNYNEIEKSDEQLKNLANRDSNSNAFGLVTPIAVEGDSFTDTIPAKGSNRFFYKLRVVFASGHKSAWSECSKGVYQFPSTPKKIEDFTVVKYQDQYMVSWENPFNSNIDGYLFYKKEENEILTLLKEVKSDELVFKPRFIPENLLIFSKPIEVTPFTQNLENEEEIVEYLLKNVSVVGLQEDSSLEIGLDGDESSFLYEIKEDRYYIRGLKRCNENLSDFEKVKISVQNLAEAFEEVVGRDENVCVVYLEEEEIKKDDLVVVPYVEIDSSKLWERG